MKNNNKNDNKKKIGAEQIGLLPNYIAKRKIVLQCRNCIARNRGESCGIVLQDG